MVLTGVQLLGLAGAFMTMIDFTDHPESPTPAPHLKIISIVLQVLGLAFHVGYLVTYACALHYIHKYGFVANVGMVFPCAPLSLVDFQPSSETTASRLNAEAQLSTAAEEDVEVAPMNSQRNHEECLSSKSGKKLRQSKIKVAVNAFCVFLLLELPILLAITFLTQLWDVPILKGNQILNTFMSLQLIVGPSADVLYSLLFVLITDIAIQQISDARSKLVSSASFQRQNYVQQVGETNITSCAVAEVNCLKQTTAAWLETMSPWFVLHQTCVLLEVLGGIAALFEYHSLPPWWQAGYLYPAMVISFVLPLITASRVTRHWDKMASDVITSDQWLPDHWQEHMYLRQFLEHSPGGFFVLGFRLSGNILVPMVAVLLSVLASLHQLV